MKKIILGFLIAPLAAGLLQGLLFANLIALIVTWIAAYPFVIVLGVPGFLLLYKYGWLQLWQVVFSGTLLGALCGFIFSQIATFENFSTQLVVKGSGFFLINGFVVSLVFWFIALRDIDSGNTVQPTIKK